MLTAAPLNTARVTFGKKLAELRQRPGTVHPRDRGNQIFLPLFGVLNNHHQRSLTTKKEYESHHEKSEAVWRRQQRAVNQFAAHCFSYSLFALLTDYFITFSVIIFKTEAEICPLCSSGSTQITALAFFQRLWTHIQKSPIIPAVRANETAEKGHTNV